MSIQVCYQIQYKNNIYTGFSKAKFAALHGEVHLRT